MKLIHLSEKLEGFYISVDYGLIYILKKNKQPSKLPISYLINLHVGVNCKSTGFELT